MSKLSPNQIESVLRAARPLQPYDHANFLQDVSVALTGLSEVGDGIVHRVIRDVQRKFFDPPTFTERTGPPRWR